MNQPIDTTCEHIKLRLIATAVGLQQCTGAAANLVPIPGGRFVAIGTLEGIAKALPVEDAAHLASQPQATKAQAEPVDQGHVLRTLRRLLDGSQPKDIPGAVAVIDSALNAGIAWSYDITPPDGFINYVKANYTGDVHFHDPEWHAMRLWNAAMKNVGARLAASVAKEAPAVPEGFALVPLKLTPEMRAAWDKSPQYEDDSVEFAEAYRAMLAAAHQAPVAMAEQQRPTDDDLWDATLRDRDTYHEWVDKLAGAIAKHFKAEIGEHSNMNCPWAEALEVIEGAEPVASVAKEATKEAETGVQANVLPPFAAPASQHSASVTVLSDDEITQAWDSMPGQPGGFLKSFGYWLFARTIEAEVARRFRAQGGITNTESSGRAPTTSTVSAPWLTLQQVADRLNGSGVMTPDEFRIFLNGDGVALLPHEIVALANLFAHGTEGSQAAPEEVRNQALLDAARYVDDLQADDQILTFNVIADGIRALRTTSTDTEKGGA
jgi:hypothetical protein